MRLTNGLRDRILRSIMADIPTTDFAALAREEILDATIKALPPGVRKMWKDPETHGFIRTASIYTDCGVIRANVPAIADYDPSNVPAEAMAAFKARCGEVRAERERLGELKSVIAANLASVTTDTALAERFPEFVPYLPVVRSSANLPATTDLTDRLKAAGWTAPALADADTP